jgi:hypothetical protein
MADTLQTDLHPVLSKFYLNMCVLGCKVDEIEAV